MPTQTANRASSSALPGSGTAEPKPNVMTGSTAAAATTTTAAAATTTTTAAAATKATATTKRRRRRRRRQLVSRQRHLKLSEPPTGEFRPHLLRRHHPLLPPQHLRQLQPLHP